MIDNDSLGVVLKTASETAQYYLDQSAGKPLKNFLGGQIEKQLYAHIPMLRAGDLTLAIMRGLEHETRGTAQHAQALPVLAGLDESMRVFAGQLLAWERPDHFDSVEKARRCLNELVGYTAETVHSEAMISSVYGENSAMTAMWLPMQRGVDHLIAKGEGKLLAKLANSVQGVHDDNDLAVAFSGLRREALARYVLSEDEEMGQLAYAMWQVDRDIMRGDQQQSYEEFMTYEMGRLNHEYVPAVEQRASAGPRLA